MQTFEPAVANYFGSPPVEWELCFHSIKSCNCTLFWSMFVRARAELVGEVLEVIKNIQGKTMLIVTHELKFARALADKFVFMSGGQIIEESPTAEFFSKPKHQRTRQFLDKFSVLEEYCI